MEFTEKVVWALILLAESWSPRLPVQLSKIQKQWKFFWPLISYFGREYFEQLLHGDPNLILADGHSALSDWILAEKTMVLLMEINHRDLLQRHHGI